MSVYLTKSMLSKLNKVKYSICDYNEDDCSSGDPWQKLSVDGKVTVQLAKDTICRVCANRGSIPLSNKLNGYDIMGALCSITNISISPDDSLPKYICNECLETLKVAMTFKNTCETTDKRFRKILNPLGDPLFHSYPYSKHDFQLILHQMKLKRVKMEQKRERERKRKERVQQKKNHSKVKEIKCSPCDMVFETKEHLAAHRREAQCMRRACDVCGQLVLSIGQHMRHIHKRSVPHKCPTCGKEFPIIARLKSHMLVHTNTFNFFCDLCPYKCKHKYYLVMHMRTHTGEKPYKCAHCPATFVNPSNLNKHKLTHQEKQFKCMLCEKAFRTNGALREHHDATHMNIKHTCAYCGRDFRYKSDLRKHEIRYHNRTKRAYVGGEPTYKQVERLQKMQEESEMEKWRAHSAAGAVVLTEPYVDHSKEYVQAQQVYFSDVIIQQPNDGQPQTVQITLPELVLKKDDVKIYETEQTIAYF
ncbi:PREDICTED: zinc finger protein 665-like [Papilio xuthus]|uniref:Zinc finger protein 665-like n=1 Tax=Papilio xuthus TaxID=66420 RepID=A0AAJ7EAB7_PAPXU|nr:PREDICTED: zinc finger protein 665-like [Papilio xuthus]